MRVYCDNGHKRRVINPQQNNEWHHIRLKCSRCSLDYIRKDAAWNEAVDKLDAAGMTEISLLSLARFAT